jgi:hypothetical protein
MTLGGPGGDAAAVVAALRAVTGVADAEILPDESGGPGTLRLQLSPGADEVLVATTVHRLLGERFGLGVDAGRVQVVEEAVTRRPGATPPPAGRTSGAQDAPAAGARGRADADEDTRESGGGLGNEPGAEPAREPAGAPAGELDEPVGSVAEGRPPRLAVARAEPVVDLAAAVDEDAPDTAVTDVELEDDIELDATLVGRTRLLIHRMQLISARQGVTSEVTLEFSGREHTGRAGAATTPSSVHRSVALATLRAVEGALGGRVRFELEHLETAVLGVERAVLVEISMVTRHGSERLTGVSAVRDDARQAVIRATLDALNRRIEMYLVPA